MKCQQTRQYFISAALLSRSFAASALGGAYVEFWNALSAKAEIWGAPEHGERLREGQTVLIPLLHSARPALERVRPCGGSDPAWMGSWRPACCKVLRGKQISLRHSESQSCHGALKNKAWGKQSNTPVSMQSVGLLPPAFPPGSGIPPISYPSSQRCWRLPLCQAHGEQHIPPGKLRHRGRKGLSWLSRAGDQGTTLIIPWFVHYINTICLVFQIFIFQIH